MATEPALMQVISKDTDYSKNKVELKLFETSIKDIIRKIKDQSGDTLNTVATGDYISDSLLTDIQTKQGANLSDFEDYLTEISDYAATDPRADISPYTSYDYNFSAITSAYIAAEQQILYRILAEIMNNEGYYHERRVGIRDTLWYIRNIIVNTKMFGYYEVNTDNYSTFEAIAYEDLILEDIYDVLTGGDQTMIIKSNSITRSSSGTTTLTLDSDEVLWSLDYCTFALDSSETLEVNLGNETVFSANDTTSPSTKYFDSIGNIGKNTVASIVLSGTSPSATLYYTTRKIINYT